MPGNAMLLLQFIQQFAGLPDGQAFGHVAVKAIVNQLLRIQPTTSGHTINRLLVRRDAATTLLFRAALRLLS